MKKLLMISVVAVSLAIGAFGGNLLTKSMTSGSSYTNIYESDGKGRIEVFGQMSGYNTPTLYNKLQALKSQGISELEIFIMSPGGVVVDAFGFCDLISKAKSEGFHVTTIARGMVASAAVPVFLSGDHRIAGPSTVFMLHKPGRPDPCDGNCKEYFDINEHIYINLVADHCDLTYEEVDKYCADETWFTAKEAKRFGMVDEIG